MPPPPPPPPPPFQGSLAAYPSTACPPVKPPHEDDLGAGAGDGDVLTFRFHSLAVLKLSDRISEYRLHDYQYQATRGWYSSGTAPEDAPLPCAIARPPRMYGCVIGVQRGRTVEVVDTSDILLDTDPGTLDRALLEKKQEIYKKAFPGMAILGWYSIGTHATDTDLETNQAATCLQVILTLGSIQIHNKSVARDIVVGPGDELEEFILRFCTHNYLIVQDVKLKDVIEKKLHIHCYCNPTVADELTWGLNYVLHELLPQEQGLTNERYLPLSEQIAKQIKAYGFKISPQEIDREFLRAMSFLNYLEYTSERYSRLLYRLFGQYRKSYDMSNFDFAKSVASRLRSSEEMVPRDESYGREEIMEFIDFIIAAPENRSRTLSFLRRIEAASIDDSPPPPLPPAETGASVLKHLRKDRIALCCLGCTIALIAFYRRV